MINSRTDEQRLREADVAVMQMAAEYLKKMPVCPATYKVIQTIENHLASPQIQSKINEPLSGTLISPSGVELLNIDVHDGKAFVSLPEPPPGWHKYKHGIELLKRLQSTNSPLPVDLT